LLLNVGEGKEFDFRIKKDKRQYIIWPQEYWGG
jgi:hypothetical protein